MNEKERQEFSLLWIVFIVDWNWLLRVLRLIDLLFNLIKIWNPLQDVYILHCP